MKDSKTLSEDIPINSWAELCDRVFHYRKDGHWIFRGVGDKSFDLKPKVGREENRRTLRGGTLPFVPAEERLMIDYFVRSALPHIGREPKSRLEWLAIAQHHGMFTRLLDWTESLLIAAFFAVKSASGTTGTPVIYAVKDLPIAPRNLHNKLNQLPEVALYYPPHISPNIPAQHSVFTVHKHPNKSFHPQTWERLVLERKGGATSPITYRLNLDACGINMASLFPDINGLANHVSWIYKWGRLPPSL